MYYSQINEQMNSLYGPKIPRVMVQSQKLLSSKISNISYADMSSRSVTKFGNQNVPVLPDLCQKMRDLSQNLDQFNEESSDLIEDVNSGYKLIAKIQKSIKNMKSFEIRVNTICKNADSSLQELRLLGTAQVRLRLKAIKITQDVRKKAKKVNSKII